MARYYRGISPTQLARSVPTGPQGGPPVYSMYRPEAEAALTQAVAGRQQRFDVATQGLAQELARMGDIETYDRGELEQRIGSFTGRVNKLVQDKYGGDYSAAANELATMVGQERSDPFWAFNKQKVEAVKTYQQDKRRLGANFLSVGDPTDVTIDDWKQGADFEYTPVNKQDITAASVNMFKSMANAIRETGAWRSTTGGKLLERIDQRGFGTPEEVEQFLTTEEGQLMVSELYSSMPELAGIKNQQAVTDAIKQGAYSAIGRTERQAVRDPEYGVAPTGPGTDVVTPRRIIEAPAELEDMRGVYYRPLFDALAQEKGYENTDDLMAQVKAGRKTRLKESVIAGAEDIGAALGRARLGADEDLSEAAVPMTQAQRDLADIESMFGEVIQSEGLVLEDINKVGFAAGKPITEINKVSGQIDSEFSESAAEWEGIDKASQKNLDKIKKNRTIGGINIHPMLGLTLLVAGETAEGDPLEAIVRTPNQLLIRNMAQFYGQLDESKQVDYYNYLEYLRENNPEEYAKLARVFVKPE